MDKISRKYFIYVLTQWCIIVQIIFGWIIPILIITSLDSELNIVFFFASILGPNFIVWFFIRRYLLQPIEIVLTVNSITFNYLALNLLNKKKSISTTFDKISLFSDFSNGRDLKFRLVFKQGYILTLYKSGLWHRRDDFESLIVVFKNYIEAYNASQPIEVTSKTARKIRYGDNTYLTFALIFWGFALLMIFMIINSLVEKSFNSKELIGVLLLAVLGLVNFINHKSKKK